MLAMLSMLATVARAQDAPPSTDGALSNVHVSLDQARNGTAASPASPVDFQNGNAGGANSHYIEGHSIPYRLVLSGLAPGTHTLDIEWDILNSGKHTIDYITQFDRLEPHNVFSPLHPAETIDPLEGLTGTFDPPTTFPVDPPSSAGSPVVGQPGLDFSTLAAAKRALTIWNGTITGATYLSQGSLTAAASSTRLRITFTATRSDVVLAWGGHIASRRTWGDGASAGEISGSPYHTRLIAFDGSGGNQDRSLQANAVQAPPMCDVNGPAQLCGGSTATYTTTTDAIAPVYAWSVTGNGSIVGSATGTSAQVLAGSAGTCTVSVVITSAAPSTTCSSVVSVLAPPTCSIDGPSPACPGGLVSYAAPAGLASYAWSVSGSGTLDGAGDGSTASVLAGGSCGGAFVVTLTVTDVNGCTSTCERHVPIGDTTPPSISCPADLVLQCGDASDPAHAGTATATDDCGSNITITFSDAVRLVTANHTASCAAAPILRTWTAMDACGNSASCVQTIDFVDTTPPVLTCPPDQVAQCGDPTDPAHTGTASATDNCGTNITITFSDAVRLVTANHTASCAAPPIVRTWTATDPCGNSASCVQTIDFVDTTPPVLTCPPDRVLQCSDPTDPGHTGTPAATDNCGSADITITFSDAARLIAGATTLACVPKPPIVRTWTATDACGNSATCTQTIEFVDTTPPVLTCPPDRVLQCSDPTDPGHTGTPTATDNCGGTDITITFSDAVRLVAGASTSACVPKPPIVRTWTATDACGNSAVCTQTIEFVDTTPPVMTCPADVVVECGSAIDPAHTGTPTANDDCGSAITITFSDAARVVAGATTSACVPRPPIDRVWTVTDACGNATTCTQHIAFVDNTPPSITCPADIVVQSCGGATTFAATASDACDTAPVVSFLPPSGSVFPAGVTVVTATATDACGNANACTFKVTVQGTPPGCSITGPSQTCAGVPVQLCGPSGAFTYAWSGPGSFTAATRCVSVKAAGTYALVVTEPASGCSSEPCTHALATTDCSSGPCPRTAGFWQAQCDQVATGQTKFDTVQMAAIAGCADAQVSIFNWSDDFAGQCGALSTAGSMDQRRQAKRQFAAFLANVCTGQLGLIARNGDVVQLGPSTPVSCSGLASTTVGAMIAEVDAKLVALEGQPLTSSAVKASYSQIITCLDAINNGRAFPSICSSGVADNLLYQNYGVLGVDDGSRVALERPMPNPFLSRTHLAYAVAVSGQPMHVGVYDVAGRLITTLAEGTSVAGTLDVTWDGRDAAGSTVRGGVYFIRAQFGADRRSVRVVFMKP